MARDDSDREVREVLTGQLQPLTIGAKFVAKWCLKEYRRTSLCRISGTISWEPQVEPSSA